MILHDLRALPSLFLHLGGGLFGTGQIGIADIGDFDIVPGRQFFCVSPSPSPQANRSDDDAFIGILGKKRRCRRRSHRKSFYGGASC